jgi:hypothetical protein
MTHNKLLEKIGNFTCCSDAHELALRAVVELHIPFESQHSGFPGFYCRGCFGLDPWGINPVAVAFPCPTIQAIEKELL